MKNWIRENESEIVLESKVVLSRNIKNVSFPDKLTSIAAREEAKEIYNYIINDLTDEEFSSYELWNSSKEEFNEYIIRGLICKDIVNNSDKALFMINKEETISIMLNRKNHIEIQCSSGGLCLDEVLNESMNIDNKIEEHVYYAYDEQLGYLTSDLDNIGTAMKAYVVMHLPATAISNEIKVISDKLEKKGIEIRSVYKENNTDYGDIYIINNKRTIGLTEEQIIANLNEAALDIINQEKNLRQVMINKCRYEIEDKVYRAYAVLKSARLLDKKETIELLSSIRLGCELSFIDIDKSKINKLLESVDEDYLKNYCGDSLEDRGIKYERAELVKKVLV